LTPQCVALSCPVAARRAKSEADAGTQFTFSDSSASEKQLLIFLSFAQANTVMKRLEDVRTIAESIIREPAYWGHYRIEWRVGGRISAINAETISDGLGGHP
jgi:hypothetical protein